MFNNLLRMKYFHFLTLVIIMLSLTNSIYGQVAKTDSTKNINSSFLKIGSNQSVIAIKSTKSKELTIKPIVKSEDYIYVNQMWSATPFIGRYANGYLISYYAGMLYSYNRLSFPYILSVEFVDNYKSKESRKYITDNSYYAKIGTEMFYMLNRHLWFNLGFQVPVGSEKLSDLNYNSISSFLIGASTSQGLRYMSNTQLNVSIGVSFFQQVLTSKIQPFNYGLRFELGLNI